MKGQVVTCQIALLFSFSPTAAKYFFIFAAVGENEYGQKAFLSAARKWCCRYTGGFQRRAGRSAFGTRFCPAKSSVLYLLQPLTAERDFPCLGGPFRWQQNRVFAMPSKLQKWSVRSEAIRRNFICRGNGAGSPREQKGYKARRSDVSPFSQYHHGSSSHTLSRASASVVFALFSER